jgi:hypothetical protein
MVPSAAARRNRTLRSVAHFSPAAAEHRTPGNVTILRRNQPTRNPAAPCTPASARPPFGAEAGPPPDMNRTGALGRTTTTAAAHPTAARAGPRSSRPADRHLHSTVFARLLAIEAALKGGRTQRALEDLI